MSTYNTIGRHSYASFERRFTPVKKQKHTSYIITVQSKDECLYNLMNPAAKKTAR